METLNAKRPPWLKPDEAHDQTSQAMQRPSDEQMDEREQIRTLLVRPEFWTDERRESVEATGGTSARIVPDGGALSWAVTWPDGTKSKSDRKFDDWLDVRIDLRAFLTRRLTALS
jgi:hypothetical protein